jgi:hypothetical protein
MQKSASAAGLEDMDNRTFVPCIGETVASVLGAEYRGGQ